MKPNEMPATYYLTDYEEIIEKTDIVSPPSDSINLKYDEKKRPCFYTGLSSSGRDCLIRLGMLFPEPKHSGRLH